MPNSESLRAIAGRLAPSPTGAQHLGNARTYLLAWLSARSRGGRVILRIEDIDSPRVKPWATDQAIEDLRWLGLDWDEGPDVGGPNGPYLQTQRVELYEAAVRRLIEADAVYPCVCSRKDVESAAEAPHERPASMPGLGTDGPVYSGRCAGWRPGGPLPADGDFCLRFRVADRTIEIEDSVCGHISANPAKQLGDFPITRKHGRAAYQLAVVVDDEAMGVTEVVRGDDLLASAFRQVLLIETLGYRRPAYAHVPLVVGADGRRLAKRHGDTRLAEYRRAGVRPEQIVGWAAQSAGLIPQAVPLSPSDLLDTFDWNRITRRPTVVEPGIFT